MQGERAGTGVVPAGSSVAAAIPGPAQRAARPLGIRGSAPSSEWEVAEHELDLVQFTDGQVARTGAWLARPFKSAGIDRQQYGPVHGGGGCPCVP